MVETLFPVIVPRSYFARGNWPGPYRLLRHPALAITWADLTTPGAMTYVTAARQAEIEAGGIDMHTTAMANLRRASTPLTTHGKDAGGRPIYRAMMQADGLGSSRLLLLPELTAAFPSGFSIAVPDRSCAFVVPNGISPEARDEVLALVATCFREATTPMVDGVFGAEMVEVVGDV